MQIIRPASITDTALVAISIADTPAAWSATTTYGLGDQAQDQIAHRQYESAQAGNLGHPLTDAAWWLDAGPTNRWAMFDQSNGSQSAADDILQVDLLLSARINAIALFNVEASSVRITCTLGGNELYDAVFSMASGEDVLDWFDYFFQPINRRSDLIVTDLPTYSNMAIRIVLTRSRDTVKVGTLVVGQTRELGVTLAGMSASIVDYSKKTADDFGNYQIVERAFSKKLEARLVVDNGDVDSVIAELSGLRATPIVWVATDLYQAGGVFGFYRNFSVTFDYPGQSVCLLEIEGLT